MSIKRDSQNFAIGISNTTVHKVAACHRRRKIVLLWSKLPGNPLDVVKIDRVDVIGIGGFKIHHVADNQGLTLVAAKRPRRHGPSHL